MTTKKLSPERLERYKQWVINHGDWSGLPVGTTHTITELLGHIEALKAERIRTIEKYERELEKRSDAANEVDLLVQDLRSETDKARHTLEQTEVDVETLTKELAESRAECERLRAELKERPGDIVEGIRRDRLGKE
jgi:septal ring factor EnvC (AmiA/AmiB activator)